MKKVLGCALIVSVLFFFFGCGSGEEEAQSQKVGLIVSAAGANDNGYNEFAINGLQTAKEELGVETKVVDNADDVPGAISALAEAGYDLIFSLEYNFDALINNDGSGKSIAEQYPETTFVVFNAPANTAEDGTKIHPNVVEVLFNVNEGSFLAGALSVLVNEKTDILFGDDYNFTDPRETRAVGFVGGTASSGIRVFGNGFISGVDYVAEQLGVNYDYYSTYAAGFASSPANAQIISSYYDSGCNIVFAAAGSVAVDLRNEAKKAGKLCVDVDANQDAKVPGAILTSVLKNTDVPVLDISTSLVESRLDTVRGKQLSYSLESEATGITDLSVIESFILDEEKAQKSWSEIKNQLTELTKKISAGEIDVVDAQAGENLDWGTLKNITKKN